MHNIKEIRKNPDIFLKKIRDRNTNVNLENLMNLDKENRNLIQKKEKLEQEKKIISKKNDKTMFARSKEITLEINVIENNQLELEKKIYDILSALTNLPLDDVPCGKDEMSNKEIKKFGFVMFYQGQLSLFPFLSQHFLRDNIFDLIEM